MKYTDPDGREAIALSAEAMYGIAIGSALLLGYIATLPMNPDYQEWCR